MILLQVIVVQGPSRQRDASLPVMEVTRQLEAYASAFDAPKALEYLNAHEKMFNERYKTSTFVNYNVVGIQEIPELSDEDLNNGHLCLIENKVVALRNEIKNDPR